MITRAQEGRWLASKSSTVSVRTTRRWSLSHARARVLGGLQGVGGQPSRQAAAAHAQQRCACLPPSSPLSGSAWHAPQVVSGAGDVGGDAMVVRSKGSAGAGWPRSPGRRQGPGSGGHWRDARAWNVQGSGAAARGDLSGNESPGQCSVQCTVSGLARCRRRQRSATAAVGNAGRAAPQPGWRPGSGMGV